MSDILNATRARALLIYDEATGRLTWLISPSPKIKAGTSAGTLRSNGYVYVKIGGRSYMAHRLAWLIKTGAWPEGMIDHRNLRKSDNWWDNLRPATRSLNGANRSLYSSNSSGLKGVAKERRCERWRATIRVNGKLLYLGSFKSPEAAHQAYAAAAALHFGEYARP